MATTAAPCEWALLPDTFYRVAANAALIERRGKRAEVEVSLEGYQPTFKADSHREGDRSLPLADWSATPERERFSGEARKILEEGLALLPEHYRAILVLRDVEAAPTRNRRKRGCVRGPPGVASGVGAAGGLRPAVSRAILSRTGAIVADRTPRLRSKTASVACTALRVESFASVTDPPRATFL